MPTSLDMILPSLAAFGMLAYWGIGLAAALEAFVFTGLFLPGTLVVDAGGFLVQRGVLDFFDLVWFVAIGSIVGGEATYWVGQHIRSGLLGRWNVEAVPAYARAEYLLAQNGGFALGLGRFFGPVAAFVPFVAAVAGMERRRFRFWNILGSIPYAFGHVGFGYLIGAGFTRLSPMLTRAALFVLAVSILAFVLWWTLRRLDRALPPILAVAGTLIGQVANHDRMSFIGRRYPRIARLIAARLDRRRFVGLPASLLALVFVYLFALWVGLALDFVQAEPIVQIDARFAQLMHLFWTPLLIQVFTAFTALGDTQVVVALLALAMLWLLLTSRATFLLGLAAALCSDLVSVTLLKTAFGRPRSMLGYFAETSGSFPSGHAALGVAFYGMLFYLLWRTRRLGPVTATFLAGVLALLIGLSRLYLVEHYLSDVLAGWLLGGLCLVCGIAVTEWRLETAVSAPRAISNMRIALAAALSIVLIGYAGLRVGAYAKALNPRPAPPAQVTLATPAKAFFANDLPRQVETLTGERSYPVNIAFLVADTDALGAALRAHGWIIAEPISPKALVQKLLDDLGNRERPDAALTPLFWNNRTNDLALSMNGSMPAEDRPRLRLWSTQLVTADGKRLWLGLMSRDDGLDTEHGHSDPDMAAGLADLLAAGTAATRQSENAAEVQAPFPLITLN